MRRVTLRKGTAKPIWHGHPWVFADSIGSVEPGDDDLVLVVDADGRPIGRGWWSEESTIRVRMLARGEEGESEEDLLAARVEAACALRRRLFPDPGSTDAYRLVHGEGDGIPGLVVDRFGPVLVAQFSTRPTMKRRDLLARLLLASSGARSLLARRGGREEEEGIDAEAVAFAAGEPAPERVLVREEGIAFRVDLLRGQKTGHYADQRENRGLVAEFARGGRVLDLYAGTGGFSVRALAAGAEAALAVDSSGTALSVARENAELNHVAERLVTEEADVEERMAALARERAAFDVVVCDPPRFAATRKGLPRALSAYRRVNARALARTAPGGIFATFSCSGLVSPEDFAEAVRAAALECGRAASVLHVLSAGPDHPVDLRAPEGRYLTGLLLRVAP
jgi:23S rRNA (cytosine1962-C5)-methyltransferase